MIVFIYLLAVVSSSAISYGLPQRGLNSICKTDVDCHTENSHCSTETLCECRSGYTIDGSLTKCLKIANGYYDTCEESVQCSGFLGVGGTCDHNQRCVCTDNYHYLHGRCFETKGLDDKCSGDDECFVNADYQATTCEAGKCKCSDDFYEREYSTCRPKAKNIGDDCMLDSDCTFDKKATCVSNKCALDTKEIRVVKRVVGKKEETSPNVNNIVIGESKCEKKDDCKTVEHSICAANNTCVCDRSYFPMRIETEGGDFIDGCVPEIGTSCVQPESKFRIEYAICKNNVWTCEINRVPLKDNRMCRKFVENIGGKCASPELCYLFGPRAECANEVCKCDETSHWVNKEKFCWKFSKIQEGCKKDYDCYSRGDDYNPTCISDVCTCPENSIASDDGGYCYSSEPELGSYCEKTEECKTIPNVSCENNKCACKETFFEREKQCFKGLNAICENDDECKLENTACLTVDERKICQCTQNFTVSLGNLCIKKSHYEEACSEDVQCLATAKNTVCNTTTGEGEGDYADNDDDNENPSGHCDCKDGHYFNTDACYKKRKLGENCKNERECFTLSSKGVCKNSICMCDVDFIQVGDDCKSKNSSSGLFSTTLSLVILAIVTMIP